MLIELSTNHLKLRNNRNLPFQTECLIDCVTNLKLNMLLNIEKLCLWRQLKIYMCEGWVRGASLICGLKEYDWFRNLQWEKSVTWIEYITGPGYISRYSQWPNNCVRSMHQLKPSPSFYCGKVLIFTSNALITTKQTKIWVLAPVVRWVSPQYI